MNHICACLKQRTLGSFAIPPDAATFVSSLKKISLSRVPYSRVEYWNLLLNQTFPDFYVPNAVSALGIPIFSSQDPPTLRFVQNDAANSSSAVVPSTGSYEIRSFGINFALQYRSTKGALLPTVCQFSFWLSDSATKCKVSSGNPLYLSGSLSIDMQPTSTTLSLFLNRTTPSIPRILTLSLACTGRLSMTIVASWLGQAQYSSNARARMSACQSSLWVSDSSIRCRGVAGANVLVGGFVSVAKVASSSVSSVFSYSVHAVVSALVPGSGGGSSSGAIAASGGLLVAVLGGGYSSVGLSQIVRLRGSSCIMSAWLSDSGLQCRSAWGKDLSSYSRQVGQRRRQLGQPDPAG